MSAQETGTNNGAQAPLPIENGVPPVAQVIESAAPVEPAVGVVPGKTGETRIMYQFNQSSSNVLRDGPTWSRRYGA